MRSTTWFKLALVAPALVAMVLVGCGGGKDTGTGGGAGTGTKPPGETGPIEGKGTATITGKIVYDGEAPKPDDLTKQIKDQTDNAYCLKDDPKNPNPTQGRTWLVNKDGGVQNVAVWIRPPQGKWFKFTESDKSGWPKEVVVDQPFCHFEPHVSVAFFSYKEDKKTIETGQQVIAKNSATIAHNTKYEGDKREVPGENLKLDPGQKAVLKVAPDWTRPVNVNCDFHKWMNAFVWVLETPYAAVTKEDGTFEIKNVPAGTKLNLVVWHEAGGFGDGDQRGKEITIKEGPNDLGTIKIKAKPQ